MVGKKSKIEQRETNINYNPRFDNSIGCSKNRRLVDSLPKANNRRSVGQGREKSTYQNPRAKRNQASNHELHPVKDSKSNPHTNGQYNSTDALSEIEGNKKLRNESKSPEIWR